MRFLLSFRRDTTKPWQDLGSRTGSVLCKTAVKIRWSFHDECTCQVRKSVDGFVGIRFLKSEQTLRNLTTLLNNAENLDCWLNPR